MNKLQSRFESGVDQLVVIFKDVGYGEDERQKVLEVRRSEVHHASWLARFFLKKKRASTRQVVSIARTPVCYIIEAFWRQAGPVIGLAF